MVRLDVAAHVGDRDAALDDVELALSANRVGLDARRKEDAEHVVLDLVVDLGGYLDPRLAFAQGDSVCDGQALHAAAARLARVVA